MVTEYPQEMPSQIKSRHVVKLFIPDDNDFIATIGIIIFVILIKNFFFKITFSNFSPVGLFEYMNDSSSFIFLAIGYLCYWGWRFGYVTPQHMMQAQQKNIEKAQKSTDGVHVNINFFGLMVSIFFFLIA